MLSIPVLFFTFYLIGVFSLIFFGVSLQREKERLFKYSEGERVNLDQVTVLIPFRNEEQSIRGYLKSLEVSDQFAKRYIFINDHSTDQGKKVIEEWGGLQGIDIQVLDLPSHQEGKKRAIRYGIKTVKTEFVLTMDADVRFDKTYFSSLKTLVNGDMYILPVVMKAEKAIEHFFEMDVLLANALNTGISGIRRPIMASGANLLFRKTAFDGVDTIESHAHIASGDDAYLLRDFRKNGAAIQLITDPVHRVETDTPSSFSAFFSQRLRWLGKTKDVNDRLSTVLAVFQGVVGLFFFGLLLTTLVQGNLKWFVLFWGVKSVVDMVALLPYFWRYKRFVAWGLLPIYELIFPVYSIVLLILLPFYRPKWKDRTIYG